MASVLPNLRYYLQQQAPVRRGPRASATSLVTFARRSRAFPNGVCVSPVHTAESRKLENNKELDWVTELAFDVIRIEKTSFFYDFSWF